MQMKVQWLFDYTFIIRTCWDRAKFGLSEARIIETSNQSWLVVIHIAYGKKTVNTFFIQKDETNSYYIHWTAEQATIYGLHHHRELAKMRSIRARTHLSPPSVCYNVKNIYKT